MRGRSSGKTGPPATRASPGKKRGGYKRLLTHKNTHTLSQLGEQREACGTLSTLK